MVMVNRDGGVQAERGFTRQQEAMVAVENRLILLLAVSITFHPLLGPE